MNAVSQRVRELLSDNPKLILGFNTFLPPEKRFGDNHVNGNETSSEIDKLELQQDSPEIVLENNSTIDGQQDEFDEAISFVTRIKERFATQADIYKRFLDCLQRYQQGTTTITSVYEEVTSLFKDETDLLEDFKKFLPRPVQEEAQRKHKSKKDSKNIEDENEDNQPHNEEISDIQHELEMVSGKSYEELDDPIERLKHSRPHGEKYGPSYRLPPKNYPQAVCSHRSDLCKSVLNDELVSVPAGSEESRDSSVRDPAAETLFQCEDDRTELDIVLEQNLSTLRLFAPLNDQIRQGQEIDFSISQLRDIQKAAIHRIYGEKFHEVMDSLNQKPHFVIPVIYARLQQKGHEWENARKELNLFWRNLYKENTIRAENQEANRFKNGEKNRLSPAEIVNDIIERHKFHDYLSCNMKDKSIHRDILKLLLKYSQLSDEQTTKVKELWIRFVIPFFNLQKKPKKVIENQDNDNYQKIVQPINEQKGKTILKQHRFYANVTFLLFMRYYIYIYDRLRKAKNKSAQQQLIHEKRRDQSSVSAIIEKHNEEVLDTEPFTGYISGATITRKKKANEFNEVYGEISYEPVNLESNSYYQQILKSTSELLINELEIEEFEKLMRKLLGYQAYEMFTFSKLFKLFKNNILALMNEEECQKLIEAFEYESQRTNAFQDRTYYYNAHKLLIQDSTIYFFSFSQQTQRLVVGIIDPPSHDIAKMEREREGLEYVQKFVNGPISTPILNKNLIFLKRNIRNISKENTNDILLLNGLECKICIATFKIFYVQGTSDVMVRKKLQKPNLTLQKELQINNFHQWIEKRINIIELEQTNIEEKSDKSNFENLDEMNVETNHFERESKLDNNLNQNFNQQ